jgi:hypothetical protein
VAVSPPHARPCPDFPRYWHLVAPGEFAAVVRRTAAPPGPDVVAEKLWAAMKECGRLAWERIEAGCEVGR